MSHYNGNGWRWKVFWSAFVILYVIIGARLAYEMVKPMIPTLTCLAVVAGLLWLYLSVRRRY